MKEPEAPKIEFPCENYPIKVMGDTDEAFVQYVLDTVQFHAPEFMRESVSIRASKNGKYQSITLSITATGVDQLDKLFQDLKKHACLRMVL